MIDVHTHILFGVDDGAKTIEESIKMIEKARDLGVSHIVLTPHISNYRTFASPKDLIIKHFEILKEKVQDLGIQVALLLGAEIDCHDRIIDTVQGGYTINGSSFVLVDVSIREADVSELIYDMKVSGYQTIIAHPERTNYLTFDDLRLLKKEGARFQISANHLVGIGEKRAVKMARKMLKAGLVDCIASDAHGIKSIEHFKAAYLYVDNKYGPHHAKRLFIENPKKMIGVN